MYASQKLINNDPHRMRIQALSIHYKLKNHNVKVRLKNSLSNIKENHVRCDVSHIIPLNTKRDVSREQSISVNDKNKHIITC